MATYYNTTNVNGEELKARMALAKSQNMKVYEIAKEVKTLWRWKLIELYKEYEGVVLLDAVASRALSTLTSKGYLIETDQQVIGERGAPNIVYQVVMNPPEDKTVIPKKICVPFKFITNEDGSMSLDMEAMSEEFISKLDYYETLLNK